jgi:adenylate cyclase
MWHLSQLSQSLVRRTALEGAAQQTETFDRLNDFYSARVADPAKRGGVRVSHAYSSTLGTIPPPATLTIDLGDFISANSERGTRVRLYSDLPFRSRKDGGVRDDFERAALESLRQRPTEPYYEFQEVDGRTVLRYATARVMKDACVACHNTHPDSPRTNWQVGDVRGVLEIIRPLDRDEERTRQGLRGTFGLVGGICGALMLISMLTLVLSNRRRRKEQ